MYHALKPSLLFPETHRNKRMEVQKGINLTTPAESGKDRICSQLYESSTISGRWKAYESMLSDECTTEGKGKGEIQLPC